MLIELYEYKIDREYLDYEFFSQGPKGSIKKVVQFTLAHSNGIPFYNLGFGDWIEEKKAIVVNFTTRFNNALIYAEGATPARTRLYQMGINKVSDEIHAVYAIYGVRPDETIEPFRKNVNYEAFWVRRK